MLPALKDHWPEYLMEAVGLGMFMIAAGLFGTLLEYPGSPVRQALPDAVLRRVLMGLAMGLTAIGIIYSPWGKRSGAHRNPTVTLTFYRLGKIAPWDALFYVLAQFGGSLAGVLLVAAVFGQPFTGPPVRSVATLPGPAGAGPAFGVEVLISFGLMLTVLVATNRKGLGRLTGLFAGALVALWITLAAPLSGMSTNPARTFASALPAHAWMNLWIYFTAPPLGMLLAAEGYMRLLGARAVSCAKLHHQNRHRCIFRCGYIAAPMRASAARAGGKEPAWRVP